MLRKAWLKMTKAEWLFMKRSPLVLALVGFVVYLARAINFAFTQRSILGEGLYLYKGYLFAKGTYSPYQDYGFWTQRAPLSYLVYGWVQQLFGSGQRTGCFFSIVLGGGFWEWTCTGNVIDAFEKSDQYLAEVIPSKSLVYWDGENAAAVLLYVPDIRVFPQQFDGDWNYFKTDDSNKLAQYGFWNEELARRWQEDANVFLFQEKNYLDWKPYVNTDEFYEPPRSTWALNCAPDTYLRVFMHDP